MNEQLKNEFNELIEVARIEFQKAKLGVIGGRQESFTCEHRPKGIFNGVQGEGCPYCKIAELRLMNEIQMRENERLKAWTKAQDVAAFNRGYKQAEFELGIVRSTS